MLLISSLEILYSPLRHSAVSPSFFTVISFHLIFFPAFIQERITGVIADEQKMKSHYWYCRKLLCNADTRT